ncbi:MAG: DUF998 domain-containing protein, partial [Actinomycetota bacterium]|nr:DUF998 domain-containing protein [Actinomycetota bacterium]
VITGSVALVALATLAGALVRLHLAPTGLSALRDPVSQYGISAFRGGYRAATLAFAVAGVALALALSRALVHREAAIVALLVVFAAARAVISWLPMDKPGVQRTATGTAHGLLAIAAFGSITAASLKLGRALAEQARWHALAGVSTTLGWLMLCLLGAMVARRPLPALGRWFGAVERAFYITAIAWCAIFAVAAVIA